MATKGQPVALSDVRSSAAAMLAKGEVDEALDYLLSALGSLLDKNRTLELLVAKLRRQHVGRSSERVDPAQLLLLFEELRQQQGTTEAPPIDLDREVGADKDLTNEIEGARRDELGPESTKRKKKQKEVRTRNVVRVDHERVLPEEDLSCESCGKTKRRIGEDISRTLEYVPGHFVEHCYHVSNYACGTCKDGITKAEAPAKILDRSAAGASLLAHIVVAKYLDHNPLHRQRRIYRRDGTDLAVSTMADWVGRVGDLVKPVVEQLAKRVLSAFLLGTDATGLKVLDPKSPGNIQKGNIWCYTGDGLDIVFRYTPTGEGATGPWEFLAGRTGYIQADAATVFDRLFNGQVANAVEVGCWSHARRRFEAMKDTDCRVAYPLQLIARLFRIETLGDVRHLEPAERTKLRQDRSTVVLEKLKRWFVGTLASENPASNLAKAISYSLNHWVALSRFVEDGRLSLDNNLVERQLRDVALGRKNFLFAGSHEAARRAANLYSLMRTCAQHEVPAVAYLSDILTKLASGWPEDRLDELLPDRWLALHAEPRSAAVG